MIAEHAIYPFSYRTLIIIPYFHHQMPSHIAFRYFKSFQQTHHIKKQFITIFHLSCEDGVWWQMPLLIAQIELILQISLQMEDDPMLSNRQELDFLLNISTISDSVRQSSFNDFSMISHNKFNTSEKQRTREESYEDIMKQIYQTKLERIELNKQRQALKNQIYNNYLQPFQEEFRQLNEENVRLRKELQRPARKYNDDRSERYSNRSSIKMKTSIKNTYGDENKKTNAKPRRNHVSPHSLLKKDAKLAQSTTNLGRSQIQSPKHHRKRESQLTERKNQQNNSVGISVNISVLDDKFDSCNIRQSVSNNQLRMSWDNEKNVFLQILQNILSEEKQYQQQKYGQLEEYLARTPETNANSSNFVFINQMERQVKQSNQKLEMLSLIISNFQKQISEMNINLKNTEEWTKRLWQVKGRYVQMQRKCVQLSSLRKQVSEKQEKLNKLKESHISSQQQKNIASIQTMIKVLASGKKSFDQPSKLYMKYCAEIKQLFKFDKEEQAKRFNKINKVKETIDGIREGRKKFNELIHIYESRISKLQEKIMKVKTYNQKK